MSGGIWVGLVGIVVLLVVLVPLVKRVCAAAALAAVQEAGTHERAARPAKPMPVASYDDTAETIDLERIDGRVQASAVRKVSEIVDKHPDEALSIVRAWMVEDPPEGPSG